MAEKSVTVTKLTGGVLYYWDNLTENDTGELVSAPPGMKDKTLMVLGSFGSGTVGLLGTLDPDETSAANMEALNDHTGTVIAMTADDVLAVAENCLQYAPSTPTGTSVDVNVWLLCQS